MSLLNIAKAAESSMVTCSGSDCTICSVLETTSKIYNFLTGLSFAVAVLFLALAGLIFIFGTGRKIYFLRAKNFARNAIIGFVFVLVGWLAIHTVLFSTGYKNAGSWWQFQCAVETAGNFQAGSMKSLNSYANIADFVASGNSKGVIRGPVSEAAFQSQINQLKEGEQLIFYLPARDNSTGREIMVPFLAGYKSGSGLQMNSTTLQLIISLIKKLSGSNPGISLLSSAGSIISNPASLIIKLINALFPSIGQSLGSSLPMGAGLNSIIDAVSGAAAQYQAPGTPMGTITAAATKQILDATNQAATSVAVGRDSQTASDAAKTTSSGDRSGYNPDDWKNTQQQSQQNQQKDYSKPVSQENWQNSRGANDPPAPGGHSDNMDDVIKDREGQKKPDQLDPDDWAPGDGTAEAIKKALRRVYKRDYLRYEMMFRFVQHIGKKDSGGECTGCGDIYMMRSRAKILDIAHMLVHEGTHSGQFCLGLMDKYIAEGVGDEQNPGPGRGKIEAIACANQIGSLKLGTSPDMREFPRGKENLCYKGWCKTRGHVARYYTEVGEPGGDLNDEIINSIFERYTQYPIENKYENYGPYQYGKTSQHLKLRDPEEDVVKAVMTQSGPINCEWGSCPTSDLPKLSVPCNCDQIKIEE